MREIKFRAWDNTDKSMLTSKKNSVGFDGSVSIHDFGYKEENNEIILMQYTGLKDKNGKEVYEGDIVTDGKFKEIIKYYSKCGDMHRAGFLKELSIDEVSEIRDTDEVIGNIYENPELLTS